MKMTVAQIDIEFVFSKLRKQKVWTVLIILSHKVF